MTFLPLWTKTTFSFLEGASSADELFAEAKRLGLDALAVTDRDGVAGIVRAHVAAKETGVRLVVGSEVTVAGGATIVLLCRDRAGYANLCRLVTKGRLRSPKGTSAVAWDEVCAHAPGLVALWRGTDEHALPALRDAFGGSLYALVARHRVGNLREVLRDRLRRAVVGVVLAHRSRLRRPLLGVGPATDDEEHRCNEQKKPPQLCTSCLCVEIDIRIPKPARMDSSAVPP